ncbi:LysR family transcriptional regulator [Actinoplanes bogorensis]|uniref:LysR family transcriptional regulator n=1 Tax=Paractinoplanes bogorensis TaxID=1610840 RepID=A0ABS5YJG2_9ACTN|nr:LysR family transcriptional regulator [Actinoplanes bogorensis]MBU2663609.1 LysR family transcriptional regulator [Actinoplanes bogorensis]
MQLDLNLLTALHALLEEGSVTGAAERLRLSVPAVSRTLGRIRRLTGDDILVRTGRTMTPTPYALAVRDRIGDILSQAEALLAPSRDLDLATLDRTFTLRGHDALATALGPRLLTSIAEQAPAVRLRLLAEAAGDSDDLRHGRVDLEIGATAPQLPEFRSEIVGHDHLVVVRRREPGAAGLDLTAYAESPHVLLSRRGRLTDPIDDHLATHGLTRQVIAAVATSATALHIVSRTRAVLTVPEAACRPLIEAFGLSVEELPIPLPRPPVISVWHQRYDTDAAHAWLRAEVRAAAAAILTRP